MTKELETAAPGVTEDNLMDLAELFRLFGDSTRVRLMMALLDSETNVGDLVERLNLTQSCVSHQLRVLKDAKLVKVRREGKAMFYRLADDHVEMLLRIGLEHILE